jgi:hypothetical protein
LHTLLLLLLKKRVYLGVNIDIEEKLNDCLVKLEDLKHKSRIKEALIEFLERKKCSKDQNTSYNEVLNYTTELDKGTTLTLVS